MSESRIKGFHKLGISERIDALVKRGWLNDADAERLRQGRHALLASSADRMVENVVGVFSLPLAIAPNFIVNGREHLVPMVIEEPSVVAGLTMAAALVRNCGGFSATCDESLLIGQVHVSDVEDIDAAIERLLAAGEQLIEESNGVHPRLLERGGGVRDIEFHRLELGDGRHVIAAHILVDTCDAMGANLVNTICEAIAPTIAELCAGRVALRILSNLVDRSILRCRAVFDLAEEIRDGIVLASDIAAVDPYRAATHNKGIMNGIDALAVATGNDWRAIEAGAHAYAAREGRYKPLSHWFVGADGELVGEIEIPLKPGTVGGSLTANPAASIGLALAGVSSAIELAELMAAVGLAQNFAALRALASTGIQAGHMKLHARSVASSAGVSDKVFDAVVDELIADGDVKVWKAREIAARLDESGSADTPDGIAAGKVILLGEHAVVYGKHALAVPVPDAVSAFVVEAGAEPSPNIPEFEAAIALIKNRLDVVDGHDVRIRSRLPVAMGLGASAAFAVAITRAFNSKLKLGLDDEAVNEVAFECEKLAHGTPSGIDNTIATYAVPMLFRNDGVLETKEISVAEQLPIVIACSSQTGRTRDIVAGVRERRELATEQYDAVFAQMDALSLAGTAALERADYDELGRLMNICHGLLTAIEVSTPELEAMVAIARAAGAAGAKLTGAGGGGSIVALCPGCVDDVSHALQSSGFRTIGLDERRARH
ncbi:MAG: hydroxymethylglutaryl-CoA reductase, degradative [Woeseiaceae bacterium]|nr:hydroxymethylglutaryl-CoA reductase, degradative [Woeseiaceae bacterium]NIP21522.1 hydroxymethylglutaryl-CoA reductase, degradative [Woeseiaceae bacterium]NIS90510.1 hydroxymethylglutaryl-CoA reductase, degradative [Woeseiaceae bacterium]